MLKLPSGPYDSIPQDSKVKLQAWVDPKDKGELMTVIPDRNLYSLLISHALQRAAIFIRTNNLSFDNDADQSRLLAFVLTGSDPVAAITPAATPPSQDGLRQRTPARTPRKANARDVTG